MRQPMGKYRWVVVTLLFFATTINYLDRQVIGLLKDNLAKDFNWSEKDYSRIVMAFSTAYAIALLIIRTFDRQNRNPAGICNFDYYLECSGDVSCAGNRDTWFRYCQNSAGSG